MAFSDEVSDQLISRFNVCKMCVILDALEDQDRMEIEVVIADKSIPTAPIWRAMTARGITIGETVLRKHRASCGV